MDGVEFVALVLEFSPAGLQSRKLCDELRGGLRVICEANWPR